MPKVRSDDSVTVLGLDEFRKALRDLGSDWPKKLGQVNKDAADIVARDARSKAQSLGGVHAKVAPSIKAAAQARQAVVSIGSPAYPMALGAEFGAVRWRQFPAWRGNQWSPDGGGTGYLLHPAIRDKRDEFERAYGEAITQLAKQAFPS